MKKILLFLSCLALSSCLYTDIRSPRAYRSATPSEVKAHPEDEIVKGKSCNRTYLYLVAVGRGGYHAATKNALAERPGAILYDVKTDIQVRSVLLGLYTEICTIVMGKVGKP